MGVSLTSHDQLESDLSAIQTDLKGISELVEGVATILTGQGEAEEVNSLSKWYIQLTLI